MTGFGKDIGICNKGMEHWSKCPEKIRNQDFVIKIWNQNLTMAHTAQK